MKRIAVIGAGLSGLLVARQLNKVATVTLFEKLRGPSGRMSTRDKAPYQFDHGAQYFTASTEEFKEFLNPLLSAGHIGQWHAAIVEISHQRRPITQKVVESRPIYVAIPKMNRLGKYLASGLDIHFSTHVLHLDHSHSKWQLYDADSHSLGAFDWVICAIPSAQCAELLPESFKFMPVVRRRKMSGCYALMLGFKEPLTLPWQAAKVTDSSISWVCVNSSKPGRPPGYSLLVHSSNSWAQDHMHDDPASVQTQLKNETESILQQDISHADHSALHRWRYANIEAQQDDRTLLDKDLQLGVCGDWCVKGKVEGAFTSAMSLSSDIKELL